VSVYGTGTLGLTAKFFSEAEYHAIPLGRGLRVPSLFSLTGSFIPRQPTSLDDNSTRRRANFLRHSTGQTVSSGTGILNLFGIDYSLRPRLSTRLTLGGRTFPRNPWDSGEPDFNRLYRYLCLHSHSQALHGRLPLPLHSPWDAFLLHTLSGAPTASVYGLSPDHFRRNFARWVSCYALFK
jgi:hypothetical protein